MQLSSNLFLTKNMSGSLDLKKVDMSLQVAM